jgi:uncharacterized membrane protein YczE
MIYPPSSPLDAELTHTWPRPHGTTVVGVIVLHIGIGAIGIGAGAAVVARIGAGAGELVTNAVSTKTKVTEPVVRVGLELTFMAGGVLLGSRAGIGTIAVAVLIGISVRNGVTIVRAGVAPARTLLSGLLRVCRASALPKPAAAHR